MSRRTYGHYQDKSPQLKKCFPYDLVGIVEQYEDVYLHTTTRTNVLEIKKLGFFDTLNSYDANTVGRALHTYHLRADRFSIYRWKI